jgi:hypothetical protein
VKRVLFFGLLLLILQNIGAQTYRFDAPAGPNCILKTIGDKIVMVSMKRDRNYEWMVFDSALTLVRRSTMNTVKYPGLLKANFITTDDGVFYVEQVVIPGAFMIYISSMDAYGKMIVPVQNIRIDETPVHRIRRTGQAYNLLLSPDKKLLLLTRAGSTETGLNTSCILLDKKLQVLRHTTHDMDIDPENEDFQVLDPGNDGSISFIKTDKFYNYRLSTKITFFNLMPGKNELTRKELFLSKRKLRSVNTINNGKSVLLTALCSTNDAELTVNTYISIEFNKNTEEPAIIREYFFKDNIGKELTRYIAGITRHAAVNRMEILQTGTLNSGLGSSCLFGPVYGGRFVEINSYSYRQNYFNLSGPAPFPVSYSQRPYARVSLMDIISIRTDTSSNTMNYSIQTIEKIEETFYKAWLQIEYNHRLYHLAYAESNKAKMIFTSYSFDPSGKFVKKPIYTNREITIESGFPATNLNNNVYAFYYNKVTDETGLIKIRL